MFFNGDERHRVCLTWDPKSCANVGKLTRIVGQVSTAEFQTQYPRSSATPFRAIDGFIDFLLPSISVGAAGAISGLPNIAPVSSLTHGYFKSKTNNAAVEILRQVMESLPRSAFCEGGDRATKSHCSRRRRGTQNWSKCFDFRDDYPASFGSQSRIDRRNEEAPKSPLRLWRQASPASVAHG